MAAGHAHTARLTLIAAPDAAVAQHGGESTAVDMLKDAARALDSQSGADLPEAIRAASASVHAIIKAFAAGGYAAYTNCFSSASSV